MALYDPFGVDVPLKLSYHHHHHHHHHHHLFLQDDVPDFLNASTETPPLAHSSMSQEESESIAGHGMLHTLGGGKFHHSMDNIQNGSHGGPTVRDGSMGGWITHPNHYLKTTIGVGVGVGGGSYLFSCLFSAENVDD